MTVSIKALGSGFLTGAKATLYTTPTATTAIIKNIVVANKSKSSTAEINLYVNRNGTSYHISVVDQELGPREMAKFGTQTLEAADLIEGDASLSSTVSYVINGVQET